MSETTVLHAGDPLLRQTARPVSRSEIASGGLQDAIEDMVGLMKQTRGIGIAAPQIGVPLRLIVLEDCEEFMSHLSAEVLQEQERYPFERKVFFNPEFEPVGTDQVTYFENCLSVPGLAALVPRHREVSLRALDARGVPVTWDVRGWPARLIQHEVDHLDGVLYTDRMAPRSLCTLELAKERWLRLPVDEVCAALRVPLV